MSGPIAGAAKPRWKGVARRMPSNTVNLDALIPREDFGAHVERAGGSPRLTISLSDLDRNGFFQNNLRKPDFQRETTHWVPSKVVDLIRAFLDRDLIPAVILWERGDETFVIDGAHRLSALIAWVRDDYGDGADSNRFFGAGISDEQRKVAKRTRDQVKKEIGTYAEFSGLVGQAIPDPVKARRLNSIGRESMIIQWVTAATTKAAEDSFFKINQAAQPIDPVERRILLSRLSPNAIASRCIMRGGKGHKYWARFAPDRVDRIEELGAELYDALYKPPHKQPVTYADQPIAGMGYNALPFIFDLVSMCNGLPIPATSAITKIEASLPPDTDGEATVRMLENVQRRLGDVTTNVPRSLGFHPLIYNYGKAGVFLPNAFLAALQFANLLDKRDKKREFTVVRRRFENYIFENKLFLSLTITRLGSGSRSLERITRLYWTIFEAFHSGLEEWEIFRAIVEHDEFVHLKMAEIPPPSAEHQPSKRGASRETKSASYIRAAMSNPVRCPICEAAIHTNSMTFDHDHRVEDGGNNRSENIRPTHPYCNSGFKG